jgi:hypothetical protein
VHDDHELAFEALPAFGVGSDAALEVHRQAVHGRVHHAVRGAQADVLGSETGFFAVDQRDGVAVESASHERGGQGRDLLVSLQRRSLGRRREGCGDRRAFGESVEDLVEPLA